MRAAIPARLECCSEKLSHSTPSCAPYTLQLWVATLLSLHPDKSAFVSLGSSQLLLCHLPNLSHLQNVFRGRELAYYLSRFWKNWKLSVINLKNEVWLFGWLHEFSDVFLWFFLSQIYFSNYKLAALHLGITFSWLWERNIVGRVLGNGQKLVQEY